MIFILWISLRKATLNVVHDYPSKCTMENYQPSVCNGRLVHLKLEGILVISFASKKFDGAKPYGRKIGHWNGILQGTMILRTYQVFF